MRCLDGKIVKGACGDHARGTDLGFGGAFDRFDGSAAWSGSQRGASVRFSLRPCSREDRPLQRQRPCVWFPARRFSPFLSPSLFARRRSLQRQRPSSGSHGASDRFSLRLVLEDDKLACQRRVCFWIALEENAINILPELFLESGRSRGHPSRYATTPPFAQKAATSPTDLPAQRLRTRVPAATLEPARTARSQSASGKSAAGRRLAARPDAARTSWSRPATPRTRNSAASEPRSRPKPLRTRTLRPRVVTHKKIFPHPLCDRPGCYQSPVSSSRNPARYCCAACRQAVRNVLDRERKWLARGTWDGRKKRAIEYQAARRNRSRHPQTPATDRTPRPPPQ